MIFCCSCFLAIVWFRYVLVFLIFLFLFWATNIIIKTNGIRLVAVRRYLFFVNTIFVLMKNICNDIDLNVKVFHESISWFMKWPWNCISLNALKEKFHSVSFPLENEKLTAVKYWSKMNELTCFNWNIQKKLESYQKMMNF